MGSTLARRRGHHKALAAAVVVGRTAARTGVVVAHIPLHRRDCSRRCSVAFGPHRAIKMWSE